MRLAEFGRGRKCSAPTYMVGIIDRKTTIVRAFFFGGISKTVLSTS